MNAPKFQKEFLVDRPSPATAARFRGILLALCMAFSSAAVSYAQEEAPYALQKQAGAAVECAVLAQAALMRGELERISSFAYSVALRDYETYGLPPIPDGVTPDISRQGGAGFYAGHLFAVYARNVEDLLRSEATIQFSQEHAQSWLNERKQLADNEFRTRDCFSIGF